MSVKDINKKIIISDCLTGNIITDIDKDLYDADCIAYMISQLFLRDYHDEHGLLIKYGYKN